MYLNMAKYNFELFTFKFGNTEYATEYANEAKFMQITSVKQLFLLKLHSV